MEWVVNATPWLLFPRKETPVLIIQGAEWCLENLKSHTYSIFNVFAYYYSIFIETTKKYNFFIHYSIIT